MSQLRPNLSLTQFEEMATRMAKSDGFRIAIGELDGRIIGVAGFRKIEMLYCGQILSVDDLIVDQEWRSTGVGSVLIEWLRAEAMRLGCNQVHLDSGLHRLDAHRFYQREGFEPIAYHFVSSC